MRTSFPGPLTLIFTLKKKSVINNKNADKQVHIMKASNKQKSIPKATVVFIHFLFTKMRGLKMVKCKSLRINMFRITTTRKNQ